MRKQNIFYTDDDTDDLNFFKEIVEGLDENFEVYTQVCANDLIHALENPPPNPNVVFLDINMPGINGLEALKMVRKNSVTADLPIIMLSTSKDEALIDKARLFGATYYLPKSGDFDKLKRSIEHVLSINWQSFITTEQNFVYQY